MPTMFSSRNVKAGEKWWVPAITAPQPAFYMGLKLLGPRFPLLNDHLQFRTLWTVGLQLLFFFFFFLATPSSLRDISSLTKDGTGAHGSESAEP